VFAGRLALEAYQRRYAGTGASTSLLGNLEAGRTYAFSADVRVGDGRGSQAMTYAYLYLESQGRPGEYLPLGYKVVENGRWASLRGQVQLPKGPIKRAELMILSGNQQESMFIDNVQLLQK
ncbi:carbohydrate binding domain-containing protein, partial [Pseudomonas aeruginosa]|uniref:carbohydrate binding domain-containing protein n=1 Tax=Pseudomonas aeruginosa TaxID=287 RepID=UPI0015C9F72E